MTATLPPATHITNTAITNAAVTNTATISRTTLPTSRPRPVIPARRTYSTPLQEIRRRQEALARLAARGGASAQPLIPTGLRVAPPAAAQPTFASVQLTGREMEVLRTWLLADSKSEVAARLTISVGTVNTHLARIRNKYAQVGRPARTKASLLARAVQDGIMVLGDL